MKKTILSSLMMVLLLSLCQNQKALAQNKDRIVYNYTALTSKPQYPGGAAQLYRFLTSNLEYPKAAIAKNIQGTVFISFIVEMDGTISNLKANTRLGAGTDEEAIRVIKLSEKWKPGLIDAKPVAVKYNLPIKFVLPNNPKKLAENAEKPRETAVEKDNIYNLIAVETPPTYPGGMAEFYKFLGKNLKYPKLAKENKVSGTIYISFIVEKNGKITNIKAINKLGSGIEEEAIRVMNLSQKWNPGMQSGKPVYVKYSIPIKFSIPK
ncbi:MAG: energy transducer TonB [Bacteroidota bacterium]